MTASLLRSRVRDLTLLALFSLPGSAVAGEVLAASDFEHVCGHARAVVDAFAIPTAFGAMTVDPAGSAVRSDAPALTTRAMPEAAWGARDEPCADPVVAVLRARDYARERGALLLQTFETRVDASAFELDAIDGAFGILRVPAEQGVQVVDGLFSLALDAADVAFEVDPEEVDDLLARHAMGALSLRLRWTIATREAPRELFCEEVVDGATRVLARLVSAELVEPLTQVRRADARAASWVDDHVRRVAAEASTVAPELRPSVAVTSIDVTGTRGCEEDEAMVVQTTLETLWVDCYVAGLAKNARLRGALVMALETDGRGQVRDVEVTNDMLQDDDVTACIEGSLRSLRLSAAEGEPWLVRATVMFQSGS